MSVRVFEAIERADRGVLIGPGAAEKILLQKSSGCDQDGVGQKDPLDSLWAFFLGGGFDPGIAPEEVRTDGEIEDQ
jgi:hypothetical protein